MKWYNFFSAFFFHHIQILLVFLQIRRLSLAFNTKNIKSVVLGANTRFGQNQYKTTLVSVSLLQEWLSSVPSAVAPPPDPVSEENHASEELTSEEDESDDDIELSQQH